MWESWLILLVVGFGGLGLGVGLVLGAEVVRGLRRRMKDQEEDG